jgi:hypothetical protein
MTRKLKAPKESQTSANQDEYATFESALKKILTVSHNEVQKRITRSASDRASNGKG